MQNFFDRFKPKDEQKKNKTSNDNSNPLNGLFGGPKKFSGQGQSLGGNAKPGKVISVTLSEPGPLGMRIEKSSTSKSAIVGMVVDDSQAAKAGLQRGDILCFANTNGQEEIMYDMFLELAKSTQRPLCFEVRRIVTGITTNNKKNTDTATVSDTNNKDAHMTAEAYARKQAMIAAAEQREKKFKQATKPVKTGFVPKKKETVPDTQFTEFDTEASRAARQAAKEAEAKTAAALGYNPYEVNKMNSGQARNAVAGGGQQGDTTITTTTTIPTTATPAPGTVSSPTDPTTTTSSSSFIPPPEDFHHAFETLVTSSTDPTEVNNSLTIMSKLITNATTKQDDKFKKVRLANPKIKAAIVDVPGAIDIMLQVGFTLTTEMNNAEEESILIYTTNTSTQTPWIPTAVKQMQEYVTNHSS